MNKPLCIISSPIDCYSGYSSRSRDFIKSLIKLKDDEWDIKLLSQRWGNTSFGYLEDHNESDLQSRIIPSLTQQPDYWFQISVPSEFQPVGKIFSCGVTAGIETTICDPSWIEGLNRMNLTLVSSEHAKKTFEQSQFEKRDKNTNQIVGLIKLEKPLQVLFEGACLDKYFYINNSDLEETDLVKSLDNIEEDFSFLVIGHWLPGQIGEDRKNIGYTIKAFLETFKNKKSKPALILKTSHGNNSIIDREEILKKIDTIKKTVKGDLPNVYLLHGDLEDKDINDLYNHNKIKVMVSLTKGEGFGRPLLEFSLSKKPIIASNWSGHLDFLHPEYNILVNGTLTNVHPSAAVKNMILTESQWFTPNDVDVAEAFLNVYKNYDKWLEKAKRQAHYAKINFSFEKMTEYLNNILKENMIQRIALKLPKLKKIE